MTDEYRAGVIHGLNLGKTIVDYNRNYFTDLNNMDFDKHVVLTSVERDIDTAINDYLRGYVSTES